MTRRDEVIRMAREAGFALSDNATDEAIGRFERFAALVAAAERERCTDLVSALSMRDLPEHQTESGIMQIVCGVVFAAAIRALKDGEE